SYYALLLNRHSFPTRRSSDLKIDGIQSGLDYQERTIDKSTVTFLILLALAVLAASLLTGIWMAGRKARRIKQSIWNVTSRSLLRSEEHTSELQSRENLVCRLL